MAHIDLRIFEGGIKDHKWVYKRMMYFLTVDKKNNIVGKKGHHINLQIIESESRLRKGTRNKYEDNPTGWTKHVERKWIINCKKKQLCNNDSRWCFTWISSLPQ
jgi:hypothetical protein